MAKTTKRLSEFDANQTLQGSYNDVNATISVDGFVTGKVNRAVDFVSVSSTIDDLQFTEDSNILYVIRLTYTNSTKSALLRVERTV